MDQHIQSDIKFCICSFTDLLGFSSHLEVGSDLRTNIGQQVIQRLQILETAISHLEKDRLANPDYYPESFHYARINDAIVITMDLPEGFTPRIGENKLGSVTKEYFDQIYSQVNGSFKGDETDDDINSKINEVMSPDIDPVLLFVGFVSRIHLFINTQESNLYFPGPKTVISTGYRKVFLRQDKSEDFLSANFAFSNAYIAESKLKGAKFYIDNSVLQLLSINSFSRNLIRYSVLIREESEFDPTKDYQDFLVLNDLNEKVFPPFEIELFRKKYLFRETNVRVTTLMQIIPKLKLYLQSNIKVNPVNVYSSFISAITVECDFETLRKKNRPLFGMMYLDIASDIIAFFDRLTNQESDYLKKIEEQRKDLIMKQILTINVK